MNAPADLPRTIPGNDPVALALLGLDLRAAASDVVQGVRLIDDTGVDATTRLQLNRVRTAAQVLARLIEEGLSLMTAIPNVQEHGPGVAADPFQARIRPTGSAISGTRLGVHTARRLADRLGGELSVRNLPEGGAELKLVLPGEDSTSRQATSPIPADETAPVPDLSRMKVLLAEDCATNQALISQMLYYLGAEVEVAHDGVDALNWLERETFDLVLIDIEMPRLSGLDVIRALRAMPGRAAQTPVLAVTAHVLRANLDPICTAGADGILHKPLSGFSAFAAAIRSVLESIPIAPAVQVQANDWADCPEMEDGRFEHLLEISGPEGAKELVARLYEDLQTVQRELGEAMNVWDWAEIRSQTHVLVSLAGVVGAVRLQKAAEELNSVAHQHDATVASSLQASLFPLLDGLLHHVSDRALASKAVP